MEIKEITEDEIKNLAATIGSSATRHLREFAEDKREDALLAELRMSGKPKKEQVLEYLQRTPRERAKNQYVSRNLSIDTLKLKRIREELEAENKIYVSMFDGVIHLRAQHRVKK